jgi:hypothetical protein
MQIEKHGAGGVAGVGDVHSAAGQFPQQPTIHRAECQAAGCGKLSCAGNVLQNPGNLAAGEVGVDQQAGSLLDETLVTLRFQVFTKRGGAAILPDNGVADGLAGGAIPHDRRFSLVGNADSGDVAGLHVCLGQSFQGDCNLRCRDLFRIVLDPSGLGENLCELALGHGSDGAFVIKQERSRTGCALIERKNVRQETSCFLRTLH